jgi:hypothetical protein
MCNFFDFEHAEINIEIRSITVCNCSRFECAVKRQAPDINQRILATQVMKKVMGAPDKIP